ncbi:hypothetical protein DICVIV_14072 [Dictyocaulus viviparus]|uniref:Uncharacterized protein n=1 Tax=Dictyocaulus viviparus TaxID=29172 RepID=A0A0D8X651_DICVI|nr:hypothetical protein DICVIV_14072 [Dictyocaulus viviparus]
MRRSLVMIEVMSRLHFYKSSMICWYAFAQNGNFWSRKKMIFMESVQQM